MALWSNGQNVANLWKPAICQNMVALVAADIFLELVKTLPFYGGPVGQYIAFSCLCLFSIMDLVKWSKRGQLVEIGGWSKGGRIYVS